jgi:RHH-type rel operon transcriptional repressor/antitoxin RelB
MEDYYLAADVLERVRKGEERVYSLDEVEKSLGLED